MRVISQKLLLGDIMKNLEQIKSEYKSETLDGRDLHRLMQFIPEPMLKDFGLELKDEYKGKHVVIQIKREAKNQTELHSELAHRAIRWIVNRSTGRGMQTGIEIPITLGYVVDALAIGDLQMRFDSYFKGNEGHPIEDYIFLFEAKTSKTDFNNTFRQNGNTHDNRLKPIANLHWIVTPKNLVNIDEVPEFWGLLEASGQGLREIKRPRFCKMELNEIYRIGYTLLRYKFRWGYPENLERLICPDCASWRSG